MSATRSFHDEFTRIVEHLRTEPELDWRKTRDEIIDLHDLASEGRDFEASLELYWTLIKLVKRGSGVADLKKFEELSSQEYVRLLISENIRGRTDGNIDPLKMKNIAEREISAGRMRSDNELYLNTLHFTETISLKSEKKSFFKRLFGF